MERKRSCQEPVRCLLYGRFLHITPDPVVLRQRLGRVESRRKGARPAPMTIDDFVNKLESAAAGMTQDMVEKEMRGYFQAEDLPGLDRKITGGIRRVIESMRE